MSHLIIEQGKDVGREVAVPASGIKFGRSPANDLVLEDEALMLFQGRFFFKSDGSLWVTDFSVGEKSHIGGVPIDEQQLKVGDLVESGSTSFRVISTRQDDAAVPPASAPAEEEIDLGFKPAHKAVHAGSRARGQEKHHTSPLFRVLQVLVILLLLLLVVMGAATLLNAKKPAGNGVHMKGMFVSYENVRADGKNIFRYSLELTPQGQATFTVDDARNRHFSKSARLSAEELATLKRRVLESGFFELGADRIGKADNEYKLCDIAVGCDGAFNHIRVLNRVRPPEMHRVAELLEGFAFDALGVSRSLLLDDAELIACAKEAYQLGADRYRERLAGQENLAQSIRHLNESVNYLEMLEPKPSPYEEAMKLLAKARLEQKDRYREYMFAADKAMKVGDWNEARRQLRLCTQLISDRSDERHETIAHKMIEVEARLR
jgi:hypothetical protein